MQVDDGGGFMSQDDVVKVGAVVDGVAVVVVVVGLLVAEVGVGIAFRSGGALMRGSGHLLLCGFCPSERGIALGLEGLGAFLALGGRGGSGGGLRGGWGVPVMVTGGATSCVARGPGMARDAA